MPPLGGAVLAGAVRAGLRDAFTGLAGSGPANVEVQAMERHRVCYALMNAIEEASERALALSRDGEHV